MNRSSHFSARLGMPVVLFALASFRTEAAELWEFVQVGKSNQVKPTWVVHAGKAQIEEDGRHLEIFAYYDGDDANGRSNPRDIARMVISGTIGSDRTIEATATLLNTDRSPWKVSGRYVVRTEHEIWGGIRKVVTYKEIIFGHPPNAESLGFLGRDVRDE